MTRFDVSYTAVFVLSHYAQTYGGVLHEKETKTAAWETNSLMTLWFPPPPTKIFRKKEKIMCGTTIFWINIPNLISSFSIVLANQSCNIVYLFKPKKQWLNGTKNGHVDIFEWVCFKKLSSILEIFEARLASCTMVKTVFEYELVSWLLHYGCSSRNQWIWSRPVSKRVIFKMINAFLVFIVLFCYETVHN